MPNDYSNFSQPDPRGNTNPREKNAQGANYSADTNMADFSNWNGQEGQVRDDTAWGGTSGAVRIGPDGKPYVDTSQSGRAQDVSRFRGVADAAEGRAAPTMDYSKGNVDRAASQVTRGQQGVATALLGSAAHGGAPSGAVIRGQGATDDSFASQLGAQAGVRGGPTNQAAATQAGAAGAAAQQGGVAAHLGGARSGELTSARGAYSTGANTQRAGDYQQQYLDQQRNKAQMTNEMTQRELNQQRQLGYEDLALQANEGALKANQAGQERQAGIIGNSLQRQTAADDRMARFYGQAINSAGQAAGKLGDD